MGGLTKRRMENANAMLDRLRTMGIPYGVAESLRRIEMTLSKWGEHECNGVIQREGDQGDGKPSWYSPHTGERIGPAPDRERGALKRLKEIMTQYPELVAYHQTDPRGCALYIARKVDIREGQQIDQIYSSVGVAVCY